MKKQKAKNNLRLLLLASYANNLGWAIYSPLYAIYVLEIGGSNFDISMIWGVYALVAGLLMIMFGKLENSKRYKPELMLVLGYGLFIIVAAAFLMVQNVAQMYVAQMLLAVAMGVMTPAAKLTYARAESRGEEAGQWGLFDGGNYILGAIAALAGGFLFKFGGFAAIFYVMLVIQVFSTYLAVQNYRRVKSDGGKTLRRRSKKIAYAAGRA